MRSLLRLMSVLFFAASAAWAQTAASQPAWPLWDGKESVADYAERANVKEAELNLDLGNGVSMKLVLIRAGELVMEIHNEPFLRNRTRCFDPAL
jgi:hypothetical protein